MSIIRLLFLLFLGLLGRGIYRAFKSSGNSNRRAPSDSHEGPARHGTSRASQEMDDLTEQDISDADFEEIP